MSGNGLLSNTLNGVERRAATQLASWTGLTHFREPGRPAVGWDDMFLLAEVVQGVWRKVWAPLRDADAGRRWG